MKLTLIGGVVAACLLVAGCGKPAPKPEGVTAETAKSVPLVPQNERSKNFFAVSQHLELGGTVYGYVDVDGDVFKLVPSLTAIAALVAQQQPMMAPLAQQNYHRIFQDLGLDDIRAVGLSSVPVGDGMFSNRVFLYTPGGRGGLLSVLGGAPTSFANARLAPADADVYAETEMDVPALYSVLKKVVAHVAGEAAAGVLEAKLKVDASGLGVTPYKVVQSLKGRATVIVRMDAKKTFVIPGSKTPITIPATEILIRIDGLGASVGEALAKVPVLAASQEGAVKFYTLTAPVPVEGVKPVIAVDGDAIYVASTREFLREALARKAGLDQAPAFKQALAALGDQGNGIVYVSPRFFEQVRRLKELNPDLSAQTEQGIDFWLGTLPSPSAPLVAVRTNLPDGILYRSLWDRSLKKDVGSAAFTNPVVVGLLAAMAIPAFQKVRATAQQNAITNNLRQLDAAADQYMLEKGVDSATYEQVVGPESGKYIRVMNPVAGEDYTHLVIHQSDRSISVTTAAGKVITLQR